MKDSDWNLKLLASEIKSVRGLLDKNLVSIFPACNNLIDYYHANCGKMIRPKLLLLSAGACGKITREHILAAAIFQVIHDATLLHDDVIDEGILRRNTVTINRRWGNRIAVLTGDLLLGHAIKMCLGLSSKVMSVIVKAIMKTCEGEICQDFNESCENISEQEYIRLIQMKSAEMFSQCCYLGAALSNASEEICGNLQHYGMLLGTAYQILDDIDDIISEDSRLGKSCGRDMHGRIITLPVIFYIQHGGECDMLNNMSHDQIADELIKSGSLDYCQNKLELFCNEAIEFLSPLAESEYKLMLKNTARMISSKTQISVFKPCVNYSK